MIAFVCYSYAHRALGYGESARYELKRIVIRNVIACVFYIYRLHACRIVARRVRGLPIKRNIERGAVLTVCKARKLRFRIEIACKHVTVAVLHAAICRGYGKFFFVNAEIANLSPYRRVVGQVIAALSVLGHGVFNRIISRTEFVIAKHAIEQIDDTAV